MEIESFLTLQLSDIDQVSQWMDGCLKKKRQEEIPLELKISIIFRKYSNVLLCLINTMNHKRACAIKRYTAAVNQVKL